MPTDPKDVKQPEYRRILDKLHTLDYPCTIVVYGPERVGRTTYRDAHLGAFAIAHCETVDDAWNVVDCGYVGYPIDLQVYRIAGEPERI